MNTTDGIRVPAYYLRRRRFSWAREVAGGPQAVDWIAGAVSAVLMLGFVVL